MQPTKITKSCQEMSLFSTSNENFDNRTTDCQQPIEGFCKFLLCISLAFIKAIYDYVQACAGLESGIHQVGEFLLTKTMYVALECLNDVVYHVFSHEAFKEYLLQECSIHMEWLERGWIRIVAVEVDSVLG